MENNENLLHWLLILQGFLKTLFPDILMLQSSTQTFIKPDYTWDRWLDQRTAKWVIIAYIVILRQELQLFNYKKIIMYILLTLLDPDSSNPISSWFLFSGWLGGLFWICRPMKFWYFQPLLTYFWYHNRRTSDRFVNCK
jgi:hypothetical protein